MEVKPVRFPTVLWAEKRLACERLLDPVLSGLGSRDLGGTGEPAAMPGLWGLLRAADLAFDCGLVGPVVTNEHALDELTQCAVAAW